MENLELQDIGKRIQTIRKARKKTRDEVADAIGLTKKTISEWERGLKQPGLLNILHFCTFLGITLDELLELRPPQPLHLEFSQTERDTLLALADECGQESDAERLHTNIITLIHQLTRLFERAE